MKIKEVKFGSLPFRMFRDITFNIADRLTVIAGHNGVGKSTLLGLIANGSATNDRTILRRPFQAQLHELFYLDEQRDYVEKRNAKPSFELIYKENDLEDLVKICNVSKHSDKKKKETRLKVVPRGKTEGWNVGMDAKVPIPTLFLSMSRMLPIGETSDLLNESVVKGLTEEDISYITTCYKTVVSHLMSEGSAITKHELKSTTKRSLYPGFEHAVKAISLGQDSLASIVTALASFNKLKRDNKENYKGGILLIDEVDAGFHPSAQIKLIKLLKREAHKLNLQIIMTSHSLVVIKEVLKIADEIAERKFRVDNVLYIEDIYSPKLLEGCSFEKIQRDMQGELPPIHLELPKLKIYFEDPEAEWWFKGLLAAKAVSLNDYTQMEIIHIAAKLGCDNLRSLCIVDSYFSEVVLVFDNDIKEKDILRNFVENQPNALTLPAVEYNMQNLKEPLSPESQIYLYLCDIFTDPSHPLWRELPSGYNIELIKDQILDSFPLKPTDKPLRELRKDWFTKYVDHFNNMNVMKFFCEDYPEIIDSFLAKLTQSIDYVAPIVRSKFKTS